MRRRHRSRRNRRRLRIHRHPSRHSRLLRRLYLPNDQQTYTRFRDWGRWEGTTYGGFTNLPPGYWVYVYPYWYIWRDCWTVGP